MSEIDENNLKQKIGKQSSFTGSDILQRLNNSLNPTNTKETSKFNPSLKHKNYFLKVKKINLKESHNRYYSEALRNIFTNPIIYLNKDYEGKKLIIGKKYNKVKGIKELYDFYYRQNRRMKTTTLKTEIKSLSLFQKVLHRSKSINLNRFQEISGKNTSPEETSKNLLASPIKNEVRDFPLSDNDLKLIYKDFIEREEKNKIKKLDYFSPKNILNKTQLSGVGKMLNLQEKILKIKNKRSKINQKLSNKIMNATMKNSDAILMNEQKDVLVIKGKELDKELIKFNISNQNMDKLMKKWVFNLRKSKQEEQKFKIQSPPEFIFSNKDLILTPDNKEYNIRKQLFKKLSLNNSKDKDIKEFPKIIKINKRRKQFRIIDNKNNSLNLSSVHNLYIKGKNLLNQEIKLSKDLLGKKKKILQYSFIPNEISTILVAKSNFLDDIITPKAITNSMEIHKFS